MPDETLCVVQAVACSSGSGLQCNSGGFEEVMS